VDLRKFIDKSLINSGKNSYHIYQRKTWRRKLCKLAVCCTLMYADLLYGSYTILCMQLDNASNNLLLILLIATSSHCNNHKHCKMMGQSASSISVVLADLLSISAQRLLATLCRPLSKIASILTCHVWLWKSFALILVGIMPAGDAYDPIFDSVFDYTTRQRSIT